MVMWREGRPFQAAPIRLTARRESFTSTQLTRAGHFRDDGACSAANGLRDEFMAIRPGPLQGNVAGTGQNAPAVALQM